MDLTKEAGLLHDSVLQYANSGQQKFAREDYRRLKELTERNARDESLAGLFAQAVLAMTITDQISLAGEYLEDIRELRKRHPTNDEIGMTETRILFYIIMGFRTRLSASAPEFRRDFDFLCGEFHTAATPYADNEEIASFIQLVRASTK